ncbi:hypothetical protein AB0I35_11185 [Nocardia sp. NPDC050378]|uniref:hypothetical protein n=1 Tax=Nocardia sp. NPDC050378 TaxID=3155400 RepID=UPI0033CA9F0D
MTENAGVVRDETGIRAGLAELDEVEERMTNIGVHPDAAGFRDLAHAFDVKSSVLAARATLEAALERRETRGCHPLFGAARLLYVTPPVSWLRE